MPSGGMASLSIGEAYDDKACFTALLTRLKFGIRERNRIFNEGIESIRDIVDTFNTTEELEKAIASMNRILAEHQKMQIGFITLLLKLKDSWEFTTTVSQVSEFYI